MMYPDYKIGADIVMAGIKWYGCKACDAGSIAHCPSASWTCERCGTDDIFGCHTCPAIHNHPVHGAHLGQNSYVNAVIEEGTPEPQPEWYRTA